MGIYLRQIVAGVLTLTMFLMLGNMIKRQHFDPPISHNRLLCLAHTQILNGHTNSIIIIRRSAGRLFSDEIKRYLTAASKTNTESWDYKGKCILSLFTAGLGWGRTAVFLILFNTGAFRVRHWSQQYSFGMVQMVSFGLYWCRIAAVLIYTWGIKAAIFYGIGQMDFIELYWYLKDAIIMSFFGLFWHMQAAALKIFWGMTAAGFSDQNCVYFERMDEGCGVAVGKDYMDVCLFVYACRFNIGVVLILVYFFSPKNARFWPDLEWTAAFFTAHVCFLFSSSKTAFTVYICFWWGLVNAGKWTIRGKVILVWSILCVWTLLYTVENEIISWWAKLSKVGFLSKWWVIVTKDHNGDKFQWWAKLIVCGGMLKIPYVIVHVEILNGGHFFTKDYNWVSANKNKECQIWPWAVSKGNYWSYVGFKCDYLSWGHDWMNHHCVLCEPAANYYKQTLWNQQKAPRRWNKRITKHREYVFKYLLVFMFSIIVYVTLGECPGQVYVVSRTNYCNPEACLGGCSSC